MAFNQDEYIVKYVREHYETIGIKANKDLRIKSRLETFCILYGKSKNQLIIDILLEWLEEQEKR